MGMLLFDLEERGLLVCGIASTPSISNSQRDRSNTKYPYEGENTKQNPQLFKLYNFNSNTKLKYRNIPDQNTQELF